MTTTIKTDPELKAYLPPLDRETKAMLEESIKNSGGARQPIEIWKGKGIIVDGHNRHEICTRLKLPFKTVEIEFKDRAAAKQYMLEVQVTRRNLTKEMASQYRGQYVQMLRGIRATALAKGQKVDTSKTVAQQAASDTGVSEATAKRDAQFATGLAQLAKTDPVEAKKVEAGKSKVNKGDIEKIGTAKTDTARKTAVDDALKQATRKHRKEVTNRVTHLKPKPAAAPTVAAAPRTAVEGDARADQADVILEKLALFLSARTLGGRRGQMKLIVKLLGEHEGVTYAVPEEYADAAPAKVAKPKPVSPTKAPPPALTGKGRTTMPDD